MQFECKVCMERNYEVPPETTHMTSYLVGYGPPRCDSQSRRWKTSCISGIQDVRKGRKIIFGCWQIQGVQHILFWKPIKSNTGIPDVMKRRLATLFGFARSPSSPGLVSSVVLSMCFAWMWFCISTELFVKSEHWTIPPPRYIAANIRILMWWN